MRSITFAVFAVSLCSVAPRAGDATTLPRDIRTVVTQAVGPVMKQYGIPGMVVGVTIDGRHYVFGYGVASKTTRRPVGDSTLFEIGSITKTFTAILVSYAQLTGRLSLGDKVSADFPPLRGTSFDNIQLVNLGTHTAGGLPLQFPENVQTDGDAIRFYRRWKPSHAAGTYRLYSNPSIMLLGLIAASRMGGDFAGLLQRDILAPLGLRDTFLTVPANQVFRYAQGYTYAGKPRRMMPGPLAAEAYGIRSTAPDMLRFIDANMNLVHLQVTVRRAITNTHTGYYRVGPMTQSLIWEQYHYPGPLTALLLGNSDQMTSGDDKVVTIEPPSPPESDVLIDKTGSTSGFAAYVAFTPRQKIGVVLLANRAYPIAARVMAANRILTALRK